MLCQRLKRTTVKECVACSGVPQGLYCDVRQFINYVKEIHGGVFRRVALFGLMNVTRTETITVYRENALTSKTPKMGSAVSR